MHFDVIGPIDEVETIATGKRIRELERLQRVYGKGRLEEEEGDCPSQVS